jgi:thymidylate synthase (FAD)
MTEAIQVLDHGFVRLVESKGSDLEIVRAARVSYDAEWRAGEDDGGDAKLIRYLRKNHHTSPFEHVVFTFEVKAPIFVFRQWHRHRTWSYSEMSGRYAPIKDDVFIPKVGTIGNQAKDNKQMRDVSEDTYKQWADEYRDQNIQSAMADSMEKSFDTYRELLAEGVPRELARIVLPLSTYSHMFATVDLHNLFAFITLRDHDHAQPEIRVYAQAMKKLIQPIVPVAVDAFNNWG